MGAKEMPNKQGTNSFVIIQINGRDRNDRHFELFYVIMVIMSRVRLGNGVIIWEDPFV